MKKKGTSRYQVSAGVEGEFQPGSHRRVLCNKLGIVRKSEMDAVEFEALLNVQEDYLRRIRPDDPFTAALLRQMHRDWLSDIYEWAGRYRTVDMSKSGFTWPPAFRIPANMSVSRR